MKAARTGVAWLLVAFVALLPAVTARIHASDEVQYFAYLRSLWFDRDVSFENEYRAFYERGVAADALFHETFLERETATGRRINFATIGCALLWAPFYAAGDAVALATGAPRDGYSRPYVAAVAYASAVYGWLALVFALCLAREVVGRGTGATLAVWLGTPLFFYMYVAPPMSHACSAFAVALFVWTWWRVRRAWTIPGAIVLGLSGGLTAMVREQDLFFVAGPALDLAWTWLRDARGGDAGRVRRSLRAAAVGVLTLAVTVLPQVLAYVALNGYPGPSRLVRRKMNWAGPHVLDVLFSPHHGWLVWTPLVVLALAGLVVLWRRAGAEEDPANADRRRFAACAGAMIAVQVYVAGSVESWTVAGAFGQRRFVGTTVLLVVGLAALRSAARAGITRAAVSVATVLGVVWNLGLVAQFGAGLMDRQRLEPARNAYVTFVTLPRIAPGLAWRYLFDRSSFYKPRPPAGSPGSGQPPGSATSAPD
jgi:hypothetical protein